MQLLERAHPRRARRLAQELLILRRALKNWLPVGLAGALWKFLPLPRRELTLKSRHGARVVLPLARDAGALYAALEIFAFSVYDAPWRLEDNPYVIDIGANVGAFTLWLGETYPGLSGRCYEPDPETFSYLSRNVRDLAVVARPEAVAAQTGTATLVRPTPGGGTSSLHLAPEDEGSAIEVPVVAFDEIMAAVDEPVALVKLDCEGSEYQIVLDSRPESWQHVRQIVMEYHPVDGFAPTALVARLGELGFELVRERSVAPSLGMYWLSKD